MIPNPKLEQIISVCVAQNFTPDPVKMMIRSLETQMTGEERQHYAEALKKIYANPDRPPAAQPNLIVLKPTEEAFNFVSHNINRECYKTEYPPQGGMFCWYKDHPWPEQAFPFPQAFYCLDPVKRAIMNMLRAIKRSWILKLVLLWVVSPFGKKTLANYVELFADYSQYTLHKISIKPQFYCTSAREIDRAGRQTAMDYAKTPEERQLAEKLIMTVCLIWEFDNAYRYRGQEVLSYIDRYNFLQHPIKELWRVFDLAKERELEASGLKERLTMAKAAVVVLMLNSTFRKILKSFIGYLDFEKIRMDEGDKYWSFFFCLYDFEGKNFEQRCQERVQRGWRVNV